MTVFKAKKMKGKLIFSCEEDEWRYLCWTVLGRCFEEHDMIGPCILVLGIIIHRNSTQRRLNWL
jgi:hypothetical protein